MSNHRFIQVDPPKEELTLPADPNDLSFVNENKGVDSESIIFTSTVPTFAGILPGDFIQTSMVNKDTSVETLYFIMEVAAVPSVNSIETIIYNVDSDYKILDLEYFTTNIDSNTQKIYKLPTNNFSLQVKTDSIVRYYEDPVDKTIMYLDVIDSASICGHGTGACTEVWGHDRASLGIVTLNNTNRTPMHNIVPYLNSIFLGATDEN